MSKKVTYKSSGVDIDRANAFVRAIKRSVAGTMTRGALSRKGSFGGLFALPGGYRKPVLVSSTDGVGTKLLVAKTAGRHGTVGVDLVAMNVNDILCTGARPLFFLDYIACGRLDPAVLKTVVGGVAAGCRQAGCALVGGETAEMPGMYKRDDYDLAGFAVGVVEESRIIDGSAVRQGDRLIGLASSGIHSNGYTLVRRLLSVREQRSMAAALLAPTRIYVKDVWAVLDRYPVSGMAHITGGAYYEKLTKILPAGLCAAVRKDRWPVPAIFSLLQKKGNVADEEMYRTFNMGIGFVMAVRPKAAPGVMTILKKRRVRAYEIGEVVRDRRRKVRLD